MKVYTKTGDKGITSLYDGNKVYKNSIIFQTIGEIDELSSRIGFLCSTISDEERYLSKKLLLRKIQGMLQEINSNIATINPNRKGKLQEFEESNVVELESVIDDMEIVNPKLTKFILPGVTLSDSSCHLCRTQTRKVERMLWKLSNTSHIITTKKQLSIDNLLQPSIYRYVNRLSDFFFVFARWLCCMNNVEEYFK